MLAGYSDDIHILPCNQNTLHEKVETTNHACNVPSNSTLLGIAPLDCCQPGAPVVHCHIHINASFSISSLFHQGTPGLDIGTWSDCDNVTKHEDHAHQVSLDSQHYSLPLTASFHVRIWSIYLLRLLICKPQFSVQYDKC